MSARTAFVTGVTGQTGSYLAEQLTASGHRVVGLVRGGDTTSRVLLARMPEITLIEGDLLDSSRLREIVLDVAPDVLYNLGGLTSVGASWTEPLATATTTGLSAAVLLDAALAVQRDCNRPVSFVQASSAEIFGSPSDLPQDESTPIQPVNPYGAAKAYAHFLVGSYRALGLGASSCILYNHESPRRPLTFVTRKITRAAARISLGLQDKLVLGALDSRRDWGWAPDYANAIAMVGESAPDDFVVATGQSHSVEDFVVAAFAAAGVRDWTAHVERDPALLRPTDAAELVGNSTKLRTTLGWAPTVTFEDMVATMVRNDVEIESSADSSPDER
ncbi:MAG: GDPmannose 4,6-dehydratase [Actinomycetota bacterium]|nr:GDPmannose 4,6-dehydratase [Actinomycetota bacterium]